MSKYWNSSEEITQAITSLLNKVSEVPALKKALEGFGKTVLFDYKDPDAKLWIHSRDGKVDFGDGTPPADPDIVINVSSDNAHKVWSNKMNMVMGIGSKKIKIQGNPAKLLKLAPMLSKSAPYYNEVLREMGKESIII